MPSSPLRTEKSAPQDDGCPPEEIENNISCPDQNLEKKLEIDLKSDLKSGSVKPKRASVGRKPGRPKSKSSTGFPELRNENVQAKWKWDIVSLIDIILYYR